LNGWFKTGDLGYIDKNGYLFLQGRLKDMINIGGMKTSSTEINEVYEKFWKVEEFYAIGICEGIHSGEKIIAFVIKKVNVELSIEELIGFGRKYLDFYKVPSSFYFIESIPKSDTGKVKTGELKDIAKRLEKELC
jgi:acyl-CoA synthetase (AMP-forming)/AMP-acid ligase II